MRGVKDSLKRSKRTTTLNLITVLFIVPHYASAGPPANNSKIEPISIHRFTAPTTNRHPAEGLRAEIGWATWYNIPNITASGTLFNPKAMTAAHIYAPLGSRIHITDLTTKKSITVTVNDREPIHGKRIVDLTPAAAKKLGMYIAGRHLVEITPITTAEGTLIASNDH